MNQLSIHHIQSIVMSMTSLPDIHKLMMVSKKTQYSIKTMKQNPPLFCDNEEKAVREFHIENILKTFTGIDILHLSSEDLISDFSQWELSKIDISINSSEFPENIPLHLCLKYVGKPMQLIAMNEELKSLQLEKLYLIQPEEDETENEMIQNIRYQMKKDLTLINCIENIPKLKYVEFCLSSESVDSIFFTEELISRLLMRNITIVINHPEINKESLQIPKLFSKQTQIIHKYTNGFPFGSFGDDYLLIFPEKQCLSDFYNPMTGEFNYQLYHQLYYPSAYDGIYTNYLHQLTSLDNILISEVSEETIELPTNLKYLCFDFQPKHNIEIQNGNELQLEELSLRVYQSSNKISFPAYVKKLVINRLLSRFDVNIRGLETLVIEKITNKTVHVPDGCTFLKMYSFPSNVTIPHSVKTLRIDLLQNVINSTKLENFVIFYGSDLNPTLLPTKTQKLEISEVEKIDLCRLEELVELIIHINITDPKKFDIKNIKIPHSVQKLKVDINGTFENLNLQTLLDKIRVYFNFVPDVQCCGPLVS